MDFKICFKLKINYNFYNPHKPNQIKPKQFGTMPAFKVNGSCMLAHYQTDSLVLHHSPFIYALPIPIDRDQVDKLSIGKGDNLHVWFKDTTKLVLKPMSKQEVAAHHAAHILQLRALQKDHAKKVLLYARMIQAAARGLVKLEKRLDAEAAAIAGEFYDNFHTVSFELEGTNNEQHERDGYVTTPDFASVLKMATDLAEVVEPIVLEAEPRPLLYEWTPSVDE
jgi:hypothetical protein